MMRPTLKVAAVLICLLAAWFFGEWAMSRGKLPPSSVVSLNDYLTWDTSADRFVKLPGNPPHLMAIGPPVGLLPSGPPACVFDRTGRLVDATRDLGDDPAFGERWAISRPLHVEGRQVATRWNEP